MTREELENELAHGFIDLLLNYYTLTPTCRGLIRHRIINALQSQQLSDHGEQIIKPEIKKQQYYIK